PPATENPRNETQGDSDIRRSLVCPAPGHTQVNATVDRPQAETHRRYSGPDPQGSNPRSTGPRNARSSDPASPGSGIISTPLTTNSSCTSSGLRSYCLSIQSSTDRHVRASVLT